MTRLMDLLISILGLLIFSPVIVLIWILVFENGSPFFKQQRVGKDKQLFLLIKFRTMKKDTKSVATHLIDKSAITTLGNFLRRSKLDEVTQLFNVLSGDIVWLDQDLVCQIKKN